LIFFSHSTTWFLTTTRATDVPRTFLTQVSIEALKSERQTDFWDTKLASFGIRVGPRAKTFVAKIGNRRITLGQWPQTTLQEARKKALALKAGSLNPAAPPFPDALEAFLAIKATKLRPRSHRELERSIRRHFHWTKTLDKITHSDVLSAVEAIKAPSEAMHAFKDIRSFSGGACRAIFHTHRVMV
jgi:hypothetical protein